MNNSTSSVTERKTKKILSIVQIILMVVAAFLPYIEGMFRWTVWTFDGSYNKKIPMSLENLILTQEIGFSPLLFYAFYITLIAMIAFCIFQIFKENHPLSKNKASITLPLASLLFSSIMMFTVNLHNDSFFTEWGELRYVAARMQALAYVHLLILIAASIIEIYKQFKIQD